MYSDPWTKQRMHRSSGGVRMFEGQGHRPYAVVQKVVMHLCWNSFNSRSSALTADSSRWSALGFSTFCPLKGQTRGKCPSSSIGALSLCFFNMAAPGGRQQWPTLKLKLMKNLQTRLQRKKEGQTGGKEEGNKEEKVIGCLIKYHRHTTDSPQRSNSLKTALQSLFCSCSEKPPC